MTVSLWKGYHEPGLFPRIQHAWDREELLVLCPPLLQDHSFVPVLREAAAWPFKPVLGVFTSGTLSASPRLVLYTRENVLAALNGVFGLFDRARIRRVFCYPQPFHTFGLTLGYVAAHVHGWELHTPHGKYQRSSHDERLRLRDEELLTLGTPTHFYDLLQARAEIAPSYACIMGGAGVSRGLWRDVRDILRIEAPSIGYGCTEASPGITHLAPGVEPTEDNEIGLPLPGLRSVPTPEGVRISGDSLCAAIIQNGAVEFPRELVIRDSVRVREDGGSWVYGGRLDLTMNRGGAKFSLEAIEKAVHDRLGLAIVAGTVRDTRLGEDLGLAVIATGHTKNRDELTKHLQNLIMEMFSLKLAPDRVVFLAEFPLNECSKLDRRQVSRLLNERPVEVTV